MTCASQQLLKALTLETEYSAVTQSIQLLHRPWPCCACGRRDLLFPEQEDSPWAPARCSDACPSGLPLPFNLGPVLRAGRQPPSAPPQPMTIVERTARGQLGMAAPAQHPCSAPSHSENSQRLSSRALGEEVALLSTVAPVIPNSWAHWGHPVTNRVTRLSSEDKISSCETQQEVLAARAGDEV